MSVEHRPLPLMALRSTHWAIGPTDENVLKINTFKRLLYANVLKTKNNPNKKWKLVRISLELTTLKLLAPRSTN